MYRVCVSENPLTAFESDTFNYPLPLFIPFLRHLSPSKYCTLTKTSSRESEEALNHLLYKISWGKMVKPVTFRGL